ncbi:S66 family peptidase [Paenibacillus silvae]|uniref:S66 family peptidase n=1 Tax=Paenibacillus silvae TaxID=1325358 RepID=UPI002006328D|nr:S66 peptidase family protein [Paenibacillus silvae]MCK6074726.1 LD-carboxypeptidase [Paenibacillus silvae]MCK6147799.1 LD-carboxypeptidase [Paenibacillus silvae]MCK6266097.1 LD-carboxypeptidase [Paenibacillus silvae]
MNLRSVRYPQPLLQGDTIGVTAPSSGVNEAMHHYLENSIAQVQLLGFNVKESSSLRHNAKCVSAPKETRAAELNAFMLDSSIKAVIPPWGGEFLLDILPLLDWDALKQSPPKWIIGYSDISTFLFAYTLLTGSASAHGTNFMDIRSAQLDAVSARWLDVLLTSAGEEITQVSSTHYQSEWNMKVPGFNLDTPSHWKLLGAAENTASSVHFSGRLLGGCMDTITCLIGTPFAPVENYLQQHCADEGSIWYLESCEMNAGDIYRRLWQMRQSGWFTEVNGFLIGRPAGYSDTADFTFTDALSSALGDLNVPVLYDVDLGHIPPQITFVNGAMGQVRYEKGSGSLRMVYV